MPKPRFQPKQLAETTIWEYLLRFVFGGVVAVAAALVAKSYGPVIGGLFLAFPALLPAALTLVGKHDGHDAARDDALGACVGSIGLAGFAAVVWFLTRTAAPAVLTLALALVFWIVVCWGLWWLFLSRR